MQTRRVALVLAGCGDLDGAEVQEAVFSLYFLDRAGLAVQCFAPDRPQMHVVDHLTGEPTGETRNVLRESARIARGNVQPLAHATMSEYLKQHGTGATLTIGSDAGTASAVTALGSRHESAPVERAVVDEQRRIIMLGPSPLEVAAGIERAIGVLAGWLR
jgi:enhancing lycopene biosynthesis protein 2